MEGLNMIAIVVVAIIPMIMGFVWYHKSLFGTVWMAETGMTDEKVKKGNMPLILGLAFVLSIIASFFISVSVNIGGPDGMRHGTDAFNTFQHGALHGGIIGIFLGVPMIFTNALFEQKSFKYMAINAGYWIVTFIIMGGILNVWK